MRKHKGIHNLSLGRILMSLVFCFSIPLLVLAQGQQPLVTINFEQFSAPVNQWGQSPLTVGAATFTSNSLQGGALGSGLLRNQGIWSVDQTNVFSAVWGVPQFPAQPSDDSCSGGLEIDFHQKVSEFSAVLLSRTQGLVVGPVTYTVCDDKGGTLQITLPVNGANTISLPDNGIRQVNIIPTNDSYNETDFGLPKVQFRPIDPVWLDPVDSGYLNGPQVTTNTGLLASGGMPVSNVAADGVTQAVVRIPANKVGETLNVTVQNENGNPCSGPGGVANDGAVFLLGDIQHADCNVDVTAVNTSNGPMAFVVYLSPGNYARNSGDYNSSSRAISLKIQSDDDPNYTLTTYESVVRPPVVLVHGLWGSAADWGPPDSFLPLNGIYVKTVDYYNPLLQLNEINATDPRYDPGYLTKIPTSALGFNYNAGLVDGHIRKFISDFKSSNNSAAVTADIVAHSMGGDIVRTMALASWFATNDTYGHGPIDKLITIGTPHLGSPLATGLLQNNKCVRQRLAKKDNPSFTTLSTGAGPINGGVGDLQGDGFGGGLSPALNTLFHAGPLPFAMARVSAMTHGGNNLSGLNCIICWSYTLHKHCSPDPLAVDLTSDLWDSVFGQYNDAVVPLLSQLNGGTAGPMTPTLMGVIHSSGLRTLDFLPPTELDQGSGVPGQVMLLLNEPPDGSDFQASIGGH